MKLERLVKAVANTGGGLDPAGGGKAWPALGDLEIGSLAYRSQEVQPGALFFALKGFSADGHDFIGQAIDRGAVAVLCERVVPGSEALAIPVADMRRAMAAAATEFYGHPSRRMTVVGITGTNGKTTTSYLIESILTAAGYSTGVIGTVNYRYAGRTFDNPVTTPESLDLQRILADMAAAGVTHVVMEISSHALALNRVHGCHIAVAVFTNLSQDHLDFHHDMARYWASKRTLFTRLLDASERRAPVRAVINIDDPRGRELAADFGLPMLTTGQAEAAAVRSTAPRFDRDGINALVETPQGGLALHASLVGRHNHENLLNAVGVGLALEIPPALIARGAAALENVPGRLERVTGPGVAPFVYVDYAHTPDALENALQALRQLTAQRLICVFGCGGDRDRAKRPLMGAIAGRLSDLVVITSDNPRTEAPGQIITAIVEGIRTVCPRQYSAAEAANRSGGQGYVVEADRRRAIILGVRAARTGDTVLIAGKGHEPYQLIGREKFPFDDRQVAREALAGSGDGDGA